MAVTLKRQLTDDEKKIVLTQHGKKCFATGHDIPEGESVHFDHIHAFSKGGASELDNIAPMCGQHNKEKGTLPLQDFRTKLRLESFFSQGEKLTLKHLLSFLKNSNDITQFAQPISVQEKDGQVTIESPSKKYTHTIYSCPTTGWKYTYATLDVDVLDSDDDQDSSIGLQPRYLIFDKVFELYRHFQQHPVLQPSIGRVVDHRIRIFDGQHKIAALLWNGRKRFECKVYFDPDLRRLNQTNIAAHDKFAQTRFFSSIMVVKLGDQFGLDFEAYKNLEDGQPKTESGFMDYLTRLDGSQTKAQLNTRFRSYLYNSVLKHEENKAAKYVSETNRSTDDKPLTIDQLSKSLFSSFLYREPTTDNMTTDDYKRDYEVENMVSLMNMVYDLALCEWDAKAGENDERQRRLNRIFRSKSMMAWSELLQNAVCGKMELQDAEDREKPFYRKLAPPELEKIKDVVRRLMTWKRWASPHGDDIDRVLSDNRGEVKEWFRKMGLTTGYLMGAPE